jgi:hypothetical protein
LRHADKSELSAGAASLHTNPDTSHDYSSADQPKINCISILHDTTTNAMVHCHHVMPTFKATYSNIPENAKVPNSQICCNHLAIGASWLPSFAMALY